MVKGSGDLYHYLDDTGIIAQFNCYNYLCTSDDQGTSFIGTKAMKI